MTTKAEAPNAVLTLINLLGAPKRKHSDNAAEYGSEAMQQIYKSHNIIHMTTTSYTPYANGKVENGIGLIKTLTRTMLISSGLTKNHCQICDIHLQQISLCPSKKQCGRNTTRRSRTS
jgi:transposase InsO family protein